jgi:hypothetical protein
MGDVQGHIKLLKSPHYGAGLLVCQTCNDLRFSDLSRVTGPALEAEPWLHLQAAAASLQLVAFEDLRKEQEETKKCAAERRLEIEKWENTQSEANSGQGDDDNDGGSALANGRDADDDPNFGKDEPAGYDQGCQEETEEQSGGKDTEDEEENEDPATGKDSEKEG